MLGFISAIAFNTHVLSAAAGAAATWAVIRGSTLMGWYASVTKTPLPTTVAQAKAAVPGVLVPDAKQFVADTEKFLADVVTEAKKL